MIDFHAVFAGSYVYIEKDHQYQNNEILTAYMNYDYRTAYPASYNFAKDGIRVSNPSGDHLLVHTRDSLISLRNKLMLSMGMDYDVIRYFHRNITEAQHLLDRLDAAYITLPPYCDLEDISKKHKKELFHCAYDHEGLFVTYMRSLRDFLSQNDKIYNREKELMIRLGLLDISEQDFHDPEADEDTFYFFLPADMDDLKGLYSDEQEYVQDLLDFNRSVTAVITKYISWIESVIRAHTAYARLLNEYIHIRHAFLPANELARQYAKYLSTEHRKDIKPYDSIENTYLLTIGHEVIRTESGTALLGESYDFPLIESLLYIDFFHGLQNNYFPKQCNNCGKWFLLPYGKYSDYCENPAPQDPERTCRALCARKRYEDKVHNDPVWQTYSRAYKAHYARKMKNKMTLTEFEKWSAYALELRGKAERNEIAFEDYEREIKK